MESMASIAASLPDSSAVRPLLSDAPSAMAASPADEIALRACLRLCLHSPLPMLLVQGPGLRCFYNDACIPLLRGRHPQLLGQALADDAALWRELAPALGRLGLIAAIAEDPPAHVPWSCAPVTGDDGRTIAALCIAAAGATPAEERPGPSLFASAFEQSPAFLAVLRGPRYVVESANHRFKEVVGARRVIGLPLLEAIPEIGEQGFIELLDSVRRSGQPFIGESMTALLQRPFEATPYEARLDFVYQPMRNARGEIDAILVHGVDVTQQHRAEARDSFLLALEDELQGLSDPQQIVDTSVRLLGEQLQVNRSAYALVTQDGESLQVVSDHVRDMPSLRGAFRLADLAVGLPEALHGNRPWVVNDAGSADAAGYRTESYRRSGLRASLVVPLHKNGRLVATMGVHQRAPRRWMSTEIELLRLVIARCWESLQRARVQRKLSASEARLRLLADALPQIIFVTAPDGRPQYFNRRWFEYTGIDRQVQSSLAWRLAHTDDGLQQSERAWSSALCGERAYEIECELRGGDGSYRWHLARALPVREADGQISQWIGTYTDIHDRRGFELRLRESELRFRNLCEAAPTMIWMSDADGDCVYWNPQWYEFTGQSEAEALPRGRWDALHPDDAARVRHAFEQALDGRTAFAAEYRVLRNDGQYRWCVDTASPHFDTEGGFLGHIGSLMDISERKHVEDATASERSILSLITTGASLPVVLDAIAMNVEARSEHAMRCSIMLVDPATRTLHHASAPSLPIDYSLYFDGLPIQAEGPPCGRAAFTAHQVVCEDVADDPDWGEFQATALGLGIAASCVTPILGGNGVVLGTLSMYYPLPHLPSLHEQAMARSASYLAGIVIERDRIDVQLKQSLQAETAARSQAEHASRVKDEFLATLSHELRTPLNAILGWSRLMQADSFSPDNIGKGLVIIERSARAQAQIIDDLLDMSAILSGKVRLQPEHFDINGMVRSTVELMRPAAAAKRIELLLDLHEDPALCFFGDAVRLQQVLTNLIGNALKFTAADGRIAVSVQADPEQLRLSVRDSGIGIAADFLPHVFDRFRQADAGTTRQAGGLGLGLSI
ncbi:MAG TPA: histidine kinase, partial [Xanthomonadaceae bacterium]|nr:histidine kinase [Xanthomonadaceae bacterium]